MLNKVILFIVQRKILLLIYGIEVGMEYGIHNSETLGSNEGEDIIGGLNMKIQQEPKGRSI